MTDYPFNADKPVKADTIANFCVYTEQNAEHLMRALYGFTRRPQFRWKDANEIYIGPACYHHYGSTRNRLVWWNSELTFQFGSTGSNGGSDDLGNNQWHYLFIDDSAVNSLASNELTAAEFVNDTTAPTWSNTYHGWYTGNDRCIGAFRTSGAGAILEFFHEGGDVFIFADHISSLAETDVDTTPDDAVLILPGFCQKGLVTFHTALGAGGDTYQIFYWKTKGQTGTTGHYAGEAGMYASDQDRYFTDNQAVVYTDSSQTIQVWANADSAHLIAVFTDGYYFPKGM